MSLTYDLAVFLLTHLVITDKYAVLLPFVTRVVSGRKRCIYLLMSACVNMCVCVCVCMIYYYFVVLVLKLESVFSYFCFLIVSGNVSSVWPMLYKWGMYDLLCFVCCKTVMCLIVFVLCSLLKNIYF